MDAAFDRDTAVAPTGGGRWRATVAESWGTGHSPNGGYLLAIAARAVAAAVQRPDPLSVTGHFLRPSVPGPVDVDVEVVRRGRAHATGTARLHQDGAERLRLLGVFGELGDLAGAAAGAGVDRSPPAIAPLQDCRSGHPELPGGIPVPLGRRLAVRFDPGSVGWADGRPSGRGELAAWVRLTDDRDPDPYALLFVVDALPPSAFELGVGGWVPTIELTVHVRARPAPGWLRVWLRTVSMSGGYLEEDAEVWDARDRLVATARQLALVPTRPR